MKVREMRNEVLGNRVVKALESRNMEAYYVKTKEAALAKALELIPEGSSISWGGTMSAQEIGQMCIRDRESSLGKFQNQIWKLYEIINGAKEREEKMRREMSGLIADLVHQINTPLTNSRCTAGFWKETHLPRENGRRSAGSLTARLRNWGGSETDLQRRSGWRKR